MSSTTPSATKNSASFDRRPRRERQVMIARPRQRDLLDLSALRQRERRRATTRVLRGQRVEPVGVEVVDHRPDPVLGRERDLRDRRHVHPLRGPQHDLGSPPPHHRPRPSPHDRQQLPALVVAQVPNLHTFSHPPSLRDPTRQGVDATPPTLPVTALASVHGHFTLERARLRRHHRYVNRDRRGLRRGASRTRDSLSSRGYAGQATPIISSSGTQVR